MSLRRAFLIHALPLIAARFRLLSEPLHLKFLALLASGERGVGECVELTRAEQPNVSKHLAALAEGTWYEGAKWGRVPCTLWLAEPSVVSLGGVVCTGLQERVASQARAWISQKQMGR